MWDGISGRGRECTGRMKVIFVDSSWWPRQRMETEKHSISTGTCCGHNRINGGAGVTVFGCISLKCIQRLSCPLTFFYTHGLVYALLQSNNDREAYIESFSSLSCRTCHPLPSQPLAISLPLTVFDVPCWIKVLPVLYMEILTCHKLGTTKFEMDFFFYIALFSC
jgi:hypothetical protein